MYAKEDLKEIPLLEENKSLVKISDKNKKTRDIHAVLLILYYIVTDF